MIATERDPRSYACARDNIQRLSLGKQIEVVETDLFPPGRAPLIVCNPPWIPARPATPLERAVYDADSGMLRGFLDGLAAHLTPGGEGLADSVGHLPNTWACARAKPCSAGLKRPALTWPAKSTPRPSHRRIADVTDALHRARAAEVTSLWRLIRKGMSGTTGNPLLQDWNTPFQAPPFAAIQPSHFAPRLRGCIQDPQRCDRRDCE